MNPVIYIYVALAMIISAVSDAQGQDLPTEVTTIDKAYTEWMIDFLPPEHLTQRGSLYYKQGVYPILAIEIECYSDRTGHLVVSDIGQVTLESVATTEGYALIEQTILDTAHSRCIGIWEEIYGSSNRESKRTWYL